MSKSTPIRNVHTGDWLKSKPPTDDYREGWERIFKKHPPSEQKEQVEPDIPEQPA